MSEAELHQIRLRLHQGERQKAARGDLRLPLPAGLAYGRGGEIILTPDEEVQARLRLVFSTFQALQSAKAVMRDLQRHGLALPVRPLHGPRPARGCLGARHQRPVLHILQNPVYAQYRSLTAYRGLESVREITGLMCSAPTHRAVRRPSRTIWG